MKDPASEVAQAAVTFFDLPSQHNYDELRSKVQEYKANSYPRNGSLELKPRQAVAVESQLPLNC